MFIKIAFSELNNQIIAKSSNKLILQLKLLQYMSQKNVLKKHIEPHFHNLCNFQQQTEIPNMLYETWFFPQ